MHLSHEKILVTIQSFSEPMRINGFTANILMFLFMFSIAHQSMASDKYESIAEKDKITIELNVNININGSDSKEIAPGNYFALDRIIRCLISSY